MCQTFLELKGGGTRKMVVGEQRFLRASRLQRDTQHAPSLACHSLFLALQVVCIRQQSIHTMALLETLPTYFSTRWTQNESETF